MKIIKLYQNFFFRNSTVLLFFIIIVFSCVYGDFYNERENGNRDPLWLLAKIVMGIIPFFIAISVSNSFLVKNFLVTKNIKLFLPLFIGYWVFSHYLLSWYIETVVAGKLSILSTVSYVCNGTGIYFLHLWIMRNITQKSKDLMNAESELSFLKQQLNPHFLLNAMNNLYGESLSAPENVPERILNLSEMLRYQIEATKKDMVPLKEEIEFLKKYLEYYSFKDERLAISQNYTGDLNGIEIPPLFFLPLVENAIKFSAEMPEPTISLELNITNRNLIFEQKNNFLLHGSQVKGTGIGIKNLRRRLEVYGFKHELFCREEKELFTITMKIWELPINV